MNESYLLPRKKVSDRQGTVIARPASQDATSSRRRRTAQESQVPPPQDRILPPATPPDTDIAGAASKGPDSSARRQNRLGKPGGGHVGGGRLARQHHRALPARHLQVQVPGRAPVSAGRAQVQVRLIPPSLPLAGW
jgi:hypothetical protein